MIPIILASQDQSVSDAFIEKYISSHDIPTYNVFIYEPEKKEFSINEVRAMKQLIVTRPLARRLIILKSFDTASPEAQNALLKTLEEKTGSNQFILTVEKADKILPTIHSRSRIIELGKKHETSESKYKSFFEKLTDSEGLSFLGDPSIQGIDRQTAIEMFDQSILYLRRNLKSLSYAAKVIKKALQTKRLLESNNLNPQLSIDSFLIFWKREMAKQLSP